MSQTSAEVRAQVSAQSMRYAEGHFKLLDQRILPGEIVYRSCAGAADVADAIRSMVVRGAPAIACAAAFGVALEARRLVDESSSSFEAGMLRALSLLQASRPTAVNLSWAVQRMNDVLRTARDLPHHAVADQLTREAEAIFREDVANNRRLGDVGARLLADGMTVLTHCNAGALATAGHGTALGIVRSAIEAGKHIAVLADETRPYLQGARLTAWELAADGIPVSIITDNMSGYFMMRGEVHAVIVGCDRVAANGDVANKIGTYMLAVLAARHQIPFYVACPLATLDFAMPDGASIPIEERSSDEVTTFGGTRCAPPGVRARHPAFDVTPAELVTALVTERGVIPSPNHAALARFRAELR
jgi:methylthioribose-1-phosphate isomerase